MQTRFRSLWLAPALALSAGVAPLQTQQTDIDYDLEKAKALYREARFSDAIVSLQTAIERLKLPANLRARKADLADAYLHLGLSYFALAELDAAKEQLRNVLTVDPSRRLDPQVYAPAVVKLFDEARVEPSESRAVSPTAPRPSPGASAPEKKSGSKALPLVLGAAAGGVGSGLATGGSNGSTRARAAVTTPTPAPTVSPTPDPTLSGSYDIASLGSDPAPGSTISLGAGGASILRIQVSAVAGRTGSYRVYAVDLHSLGRQCICGMSVSRQFTSGQPVTGITVPLDYQCWNGYTNCPQLPYTASGLAISLIDESTRGNGSGNVGGVVYLEEFALAYTFRQ